MRSPRPAVAAIFAVVSLDCGGDAPDAAIPTADVAVVAAPSAAPRTKKLVCEPGERTTCACPDDVTGYRECSADGTRFRACTCTPPPPPSETGIPECDALLAAFDRVANEMESCSKPGPNFAEAVKSIRESRDQMKKTLVERGADEQFRQIMTRMCASTIDGVKSFTCP